MMEMSRRGFLGLLAGVGALSAGGIALLETPKTIFLPPRQGWFQTALRMREVQQYCINTDTMPFRYDAAWLDAFGDRHQWHVDFEPMPAIAVVHHPELIEIQRNTARQQFERIRRQQGLSNSRQIDLALPHGIAIARYV